MDRRLTPTMLREIFAMRFVHEVAERYPGTFFLTDGLKGQAHCLKVLARFDRTFSFLYPSFQCFPLYRVTLNLDRLSGKPPDTKPILFKQKSGAFFMATRLLMNEFLGLLSVKEGV